MANLPIEGSGWLAIRQRVSVRTDGTFTPGGGPTPRWGSLAKRRWQTNRGGGGVCQSGPPGALPRWRVLTLPEKQCLWPGKLVGSHAAEKAHMLKSFSCVPNSAAASGGAGRDT